MLTQYHVIMFAGGNHVICLQVATKDGQLVLRHSVLLDTGTDIQAFTAPGGVFADRNTSRCVQKTVYVCSGCNSATV